MNSEEQVPIRLEPNSIGTQDLIHFPIKPTRHLAITAVVMFLGCSSPTPSPPASTPTRSQKLAESTTQVTPEKGLQEKLPNETWRAWLYKNAPTLGTVASMDITKSTLVEKRGFTDDMFSYQCTTNRPKSEIVSKKGIPFPPQASQTFRNRSGEQFDILLYLFKDDEYYILFFNNGLLSAMYRGRGAQEEQVVLK